MIEKMIGKFNNQERGNDCQQIDNVTNFFLTFDPYLKLCMTS